MRAAAGATGAARRRAVRPSGPLASSRCRAAWPARVFASHAASAHCTCRCSAARWRRDGTRQKSADGLAHVCAGAAWLCSVQNAGQTSKIESSKNNQASACMRSAEHWRRWKQPGLGKASTDVCSAVQVQFARAGYRVLNRKTLAGRDRDLDAVRRVVVFSVVAA